MVVIAACMSLDVFADLVVCLYSVVGGGTQTYWKMEPVTFATDRIVKLKIHMLASLFLRRRGCPYQVRAVTAATEVSKHNNLCLGLDDWYNTVVHMLVNLACAFRIELLLKIVDKL